ncbi:hypothetical protein DWY12_20485 [Enterocloster bolteae]|nr:hypothetical protein DWY12_20485 [Enterocloster bolteae]
MRKQQVNNGNITFIQYNIVDKLTIWFRRDKRERVVHIMSNQEYWNAISEKVKEINNNALLRRIYLFILALQGGAH